MPRVDVVGLGPAGPELLTARTAEILAGETPVWLRTVRHPAAADLTVQGSFDEVYEAAGSFDEVYETIIGRVVHEASIAGAVVYAVPGSPLVAERTVELLRKRTDVEVVVHPAVSFVDLAWSALGIDPMAVGVTIVDAHRFAVDAAGRLGPLLVTQVHSADVLDDVLFAIENGRGAAEAPQSATVLRGLGTPDEWVATIEWDDLGDVEVDHLTSLWIPKLAAPVGSAFVAFDELVRRLRSECPWDAEQTHQSLRRFLVEETYEVLDAIDAVEADPDEGYHELEEELGDLLFQIFFHARLAAEEGRFDVADVAIGIHDKLHRRHPHVFGDADADDAIASWEANKLVEKGRDSVLDGIPRSLPSLLYALKHQKKAASTGFTGPDLAWALSDVADELQEVTDDPSESELGDLLFAGVQVARMLDVDPEDALRRATDRFGHRFRHVEASARADDIRLADLDEAELRARWTAAKDLLG